MSGSLRIESVEPNGAMARAGVLPGDRLVAVNGVAVADELDLYFHLDDEGRNIVLFERDESPGSMECRLDSGNLTEVTWSDFEVRICRNRCVFCYVHQNPKGMRPSIYIMDEDLRLSFLYGSFTTLSNMSEEDRDRIVTQRLSPLYVSVHATEESVRREMLRAKQSANHAGILEDIDHFLSHGIQIHTQAVICPGMNDAGVLDRTIDDLASRRPGVETLACIPVGLTRHRKNLPSVDGFDAQGAARVIDQVEAHQARFLTNGEEPFVYAGDEFYIIAGRELPPLESYGELEQLDNGVGLVRYWESILAEAAESLPTRSDPRTLLVLTGPSAAPYIEDGLVKVWREVPGLDVRLRVVANDLFGEEVTAANLITGRGILAALEEERAAGGDPELVLLPPKVLNADELFLDNLPLAEAVTAAGIPLVPAPEDPIRLAEVAGAVVPANGQNERRLYFE